jgi:RNA recognition motif-containing protein
MRIRLSTQLKIQPEEGAAHDDRNAKKRAIWSIRLRERPAPHAGRGGFARLLIISHCVSTLEFTSAHKMTDNKLFVASLSYETTSEELRKLFETRGRVVDCHLAKDKETGSSRGFAFVTFETESNALDAMMEFDGYELGGRTMKVTIANAPRAKGGSRRGQDEAVAGHGVGEEVNITEYKAERITEAQQRVKLRESKLPSEMRAARTNDFVFSDDEDTAGAEVDPEAAFVASLSTKEKRKLLKTLGAGGAEEGGGSEESKRSKKKDSKKKKSKKDAKKKKKKKKKKKYSSSSSSSSSSDNDSGSDSDDGDQRKRRKTSTY